MEKKDKTGCMLYILRKIGFVGALVGAFYLGFKYHEDIGRVENNLTKKNLKVEQGFYPDGIGLGIDLPINAKGHQEVYLIHRESGKRVPVRDNVFAGSSLEGKVKGER